MAGHAQLKFVMTECSKTQIRLTRPIYNCQRIVRVLHNDNAFDLSSTGKNCMSLSIPVICFKVLSVPNSVISAYININTFLPKCVQALEFECHPKVCNYSI